MTIFKYILTKLTIYFRQKTGTVEENQKTELKTSQKGLRVVLQDFLGDLEKKKGLHFNDLRFIAIYRVISKHFSKLIRK